MIDTHIKNILKLENQLKTNHKIDSLSLLSFVDLLYYFIKLKFPDKKDSFVYHKAHINAKLFSKIRNPKYHPSRKTIIALGLALELNMDEFEMLLASANYALSLNNRFDVAIIYCIEHQIYDLYIVNEIIYELEI